MVEYANIGTESVHVASDAMSGTTVAVGGVNKANAMPDVIFAVNGLQRVVERSSVRLLRHADRHAPIARQGTKWLRLATHCWC
jgi:hypothetical protein